MKVSVTFDIELNKPVLALEAETDGDSEALALLASGSDMQVQLIFDSGDDYDGVESS